MHLILYFPMMIIIVISVSIQLLPNILLKKRNIKVTNIKTNKKKIHYVLNDLNPLRFVFWFIALKFWVILLLHHRRKSSDCHHILLWTLNLDIYKIIQIGLILKIKIKYNKNICESFFVVWFAWISALIRILGFS